MESEYIIRQVIVSVIPIMIAIILHEISHGFIANKLGDPTAKMMGRLTLNPIAHIDPFGTIIMPILLFVVGGIPIGYAKPVPINPYNFKNPKRDMAISAAGGPVTNVVIALISLLLLKYAIIPIATLIPDELVTRILEPITMMLKVSIDINIALAAFNLIPIPPLDGGRVVMGFLSHKHAELLGRIEPFGMMIIILLVFSGFAKYIVLPLRVLFYGLLGLV